MEPPIVRFMKKVKVNPETECWDWQGAVTSKGYGSFGFGGRGKNVLAHRWIYEYFKGRIEGELTVNHKCERKTCQNPNHLEVCTREDNIRKSSHHKKRREQSHCKQGHPLSGENLRYRKDGRRVCRTCAGWKKGNVFLSQNQVTSA